MEEVKEKSEDQAPEQIDILVKLDELKQYVCTENWRKFAEELDALLKIAKEKEGEGDRTGKKSIFSLSPFLSISVIEMNMKDMRTIQR